MPGNMDERVVSMEFDNKQFERNVKTSMKTIDDLKESLDFDGVGESFDEFSTKCRKFGKEKVFRNVDDSVSTLRKGIGLLGDSAGGLVSQFMQVTKITALFEMAEQAVNKLKNAVKSFTIQPIAQGFDKYTTKISSIKTIANATGLAADKVDESLERLNWFTDETSASFSEMVQNIGKFTSVGKGLDESITAMQGIAAWGYHSGASVAEQTRAMYNLSQALGTGSVKLIDWKSIENAGMATKEFKEQAIAAAEAAGTLKRKGDKLFAGKEEVTVENFNSTLAKGWFSSDVLMSTLNEYGSYADKVRKYMEEHPQYDLASQAMEAMDAERLAKQESIYTKYLDSWTKESGKSAGQIKSDITKISKIAGTKEREKEIKAFAKTVGMTYEEAKKVLEELAETEESIGQRAFKSSQQAKTLEEAIDATKDAVSTGWMKTFQYIFGGLDKSIELWSDVTEILYELFAAGASFRNNAFMHWAEEFNGWADLWNADPDKGPLGALRNIMDTIIELKNLLGSSFRNMFFPQLEKVTGSISGQDEAMTAAKNGLLTADQIKAWRQGNLMGYEIKKVTSGIREFTAKIRAFFTNESNLEKIRTTFTAIANAVHFATTAVGDFFGGISDFVKKSGIFQDILNAISTVAAKVGEFFARLQASGFTKKLFGKISDGFVWFYNLIKGWIDQIKQFFEETGIGQAIRDFFKRIEEFFTGGADDVDETGKKTESKFFRAFGWLQSVKDWLSNINFKDILYKIKGFIDHFGDLWAVFTTALTGGDLHSKTKKSLAASGIDTGFIQGIWDFGNKLRGVWDFVKGIFDKVTGWLESSGILPAIRNFWEQTKTFFENIGLVWDVFVKGKQVDPKDLDDKQKNLLSVVGNFVKRLQSIWGKVKGWFQTAWTWLQEKWNLLLGWLESSGILPKIREIWGKVKSAIGHLGELWTVFKTALTGGKLDANTKKTLKASGMDESFIQGIWDFGTKIRNAIDGLKGAWDKVKTWLETSGILPTLRDWWSKITGWFEGVKKDLESNGIFTAVSNFFTNLWEKITGLFGGGEELTELTDYPTPLANVGGGNNNGEKKGGFFQKFIEGFTTDGQFDLIKGISTGVAGLFETIGAIDWAGISTNFFGIIVKVVNGLDDALGDLHIDNIIRVLQKIVNVFAGALVAKSITDITSTVRTIVKKGKDKSVWEKLTDFLQVVGTALLQIGISVALIAGSMWLISKIAPDRFAAAAITMGVILAFLMAFMVVATKIGKKGINDKTLGEKFKAIGAMFLDIGIAVALIAASMLVLSLMSTQALVKGGIAVVVILGVMMGVIFAMNKFANSTGGALKLAGSLATFAGLAILLATMTVCILLLQRVDLGHAIVSAVLLGGLLTVIAFAIKKMNGVKINAKSMATMVIMAVIIGIITAAFVLLKDADPLTIAVIAGAFAVVILVLAKAAKWMEDLKPTALKGALILAGVLAILVTAVAALTGIMSSAAERATGSILTIMSNLASATNAAKLVDGELIRDRLALLGDIAAALPVAANINTGPAIQIANAAWDVFGALALATYAAMLVQEKQFHKIFGKDGKGGLLKTIETGMSGVTESGWKATRLGANVETLAENLKLVGEAGLTLTKDFEGHTYTEGIQNVKDQLTAIQEIVDIAAAMGTIGEGENARQFDLTSFAEGIANVGAALEAYNLALGKALEASGEFPDAKTGEIKPISTESITAALTSVMTAMKDVTFDEDEIGNVESWAGLKPSGEGESKTLFALGLINIANAMKAFGESATDFNSGDVDKAIGSLDKLAKIKGKFETNKPKDYGDMMNEVSGWGDGGTFKTAITGMGTAIAAFGKSVVDLPDDSVGKATNALDTLAVIYEKLKGHGTISNYVAKIGNLITIGGEEMTDESVEETFRGFAAGIEKLGNGLATFSGSLTNKETGYDQKKVDAAVAVLQSMTAIETELKTINVSGDWWSNLLFGENGLSKLGTEISSVGSQLSTFQSSLGAFDLDVDGDTWKNVSGVLTFMGNLWRDLNAAAVATRKFDASGRLIEQIDHSSYTLTELATGMDSIRSKLVEFNKSMNEPGNKLGTWSKENFEKIKEAITYFKEISIGLKEAGLVEKQFYSLDDLGYDMDRLFGFIRGFTPESMNLDAIALAAQFISGFASRLAQTEGGEGETTTAGAMNTMLTVIESFAADFYAKGEAAGKSYAEGFNKGLGGVDVNNRTPVVDMDAGGKTGPVTGKAALVAAMSRNTSSTNVDSAVSERLELINQRFDKSIAVDDGHTEALTGISNKLDDLGELKTIKEELSLLKKDVANLAVFMDTGRLVGAIAPDMNRALGNLVNVS